MKKLDFIESFRHGRLDYYPEVRDNEIEKLRLALHGDAQALCELLLIDQAFLENYEWERSRIEILPETVRLDQDIDEGRFAISGVARELGRQETADVSLVVYRV